MNEEEKKMVDIFKKEIEKEQNEYKLVNENTKFIYNNHKDILNLLEKQQKEIEILNKNMNLLREQNISYKQSIHGLKEMNKIINKKWKDKIKAKIEELENEHTGCTTNVFSVLQSLLEKE